MKPKFTLQNALLLVVALGIFSGLAWWLKNGMPLPGTGVPSTAGKIAFLSTRNGHPDIYMMNGADGSQPVALTDDAAEDSAPRWSRDGKEITFASANRSGVTTQVYRMDARAGARVLQVTNTSSTKDLPRFTVEDLIHYLDAGKVNSVDIKSNETMAVLPSANLRLLTTALFSTGGIEQFVTSPDGNRILSVFKLEEGRALVLFVPDETAMILLGIAENIQVAYRPDGGFVAAFSGGVPLREPQVLLSPQLMEQPGFAMSPIQMTPPGEINVLVSFDENGGVSGTPEPLPVTIEDFALSPDGTKAVFATGGEQPGLFVHSMDSPGEVKALYQGEATQPSWSPDGTQVAFAANNDIFVVSATGGEAKNLTNGQGENSQPVWSPEIAKKQ